MLHITCSDKRTQGIGESFYVTKFRSSYNFSVPCSTTLNNFIESGCNINILNASIHGNLSYTGHFSSFLIITIWVSANLLECHIAWFYKI